MSSDIALVSELIFLKKEFMAKFKSMPGTECAGLKFNSEGFLETNDASKIEQLKGSRYVEEVSGVEAKAPSKSEAKATSEKKDK